MAEFDSIFVYNKSKSTKYGKEMLYMKKINQWLLAQTVETLWHRADRLMKRMYANPSPEMFRRYAVQYRIVCFRAKQLETLLR